MLELIGEINNVTRLYGVATLVVIVLSLLVRMASGASPTELLKSRFYEIPTLRSVIVSVGLGIWALTLYAAGICIEHLWIYFDRSISAALHTAGIAGGICAGLAFIGVLYWRIAVDVGDFRPTPDIRDADIRAGVDASEIARLGKERFPEKIQFGDNGCISMRCWLVTTGVLVLGVAAVSFTDWGQQYELRSLREQFELRLMNSVPRASQIASQFLITSTMLCSGMLLLTNSSYTVLRFPVTLVLAFLLSVGLTISCLAADMSVEVLRSAILGSVAAWTARWAHDLRRASDFRRKAVILKPVRDHIRRGVPFLRQLNDSPDCRLDSPGPDTIRSRVADGCQNVEEADPMVTPFLARFLSEVRANFRQMNAAMLRFLTVRRGIAVSGGTGTTRGLQHPVVPVWDEQRFPLRPPEGFTNWRDPLALGSDWDIVSICSSCGGSGQVNCTSCGGSGRQQVTENYTVYSGGQTQQRTRYVTRTCTSCNGSGKQQCHTCSGFGRVCQSQTLVTTWERHLPTETAPFTQMSHLMEDAEERVFFRRPLVEDRCELDAPDQTDDLHPNTATAMSIAADHVQSELLNHVERVQNLNNGWVYRADFQITAFHVIRIGFRGLHGGHGWFFGSRPEFYFPSLPLSWGKVSAVVFVWPFLCLTGWQLGHEVRQQVLTLLGT